MQNGEDNNDSRGNETVKYTYQGYKSNILLLMTECQLMMWIHFLLFS